MKKKKFPAELAYVLATLILAFGTAMMTKANFGVSMVVAPAYLLHLKLSQYWSFITFGVAEYMLQAFLLIVLCIVMKKFKVSYLFSFFTAVFYGLSLDLSLWTLSFIPCEKIAVRIVLFVIGLPLVSLGVSLFFHTYIPPEAYELFVKEISAKTHKDINKFKTGYDCVSCVISIIMSFCFFGLFKFEGVNVGTVICALINGKIIGMISKFLEKKFEFKDSLPLRKLFQKNEQSEGTK